MLQGQCLCGGIRYQISGELPVHDGQKIPLPIVCHCKMCQRQTGSAFSVSHMVKLSQLAIVSGAQLIKRYESSKGVFRSFCCECGSFLFANYEELEPDQVLFTLGTINDCELKPAVHIFVADKASWYEINDVLPQFEAYPT